jgi:hypothetical protein
MAGGRAYAGKNCADHGDRRRPTQNWSASPKISPPVWSRWDCGRWSGDLQFSNGLELIPFFALLRAGVIPVMALPAHRRSEIGHWVEHASGRARVPRRRPNSTTSPWHAAWRRHTPASAAS